MARQATRRTDEQIVAMLDQHRRGLPLADAEARLGMTKGTASVMLGRVLRDDLKHSGEPEDQVRAAYARKRPKRRDAK